METRKRRHIDVCLHAPVEYQTVTTGLEHYRLPYNALTQTSLDRVRLDTRFLGKPLSAPLLIGAMTGGAELSGTINRNLAAAAQRLGVGMMLGSQRIMFDNDAVARSFAVRDIAPDVLLIGNVGLAQLSEPVLPALERALEHVGADALAVHTNPLQEAMQRDGDTDFTGSIDRLRTLAATLRQPVLLKEVGHGIGAAAAAALAGSALAEWGIPTAQALLEVRQTLPDVALVASGGIRTGMDAAKALAMGADVVAVARPLLAPAIQSADAVVEWLRGFIDELRVCLHGCGAADLAALQRGGVLTA